jgi:hypothetical protein
MKRLQRWLAGIFILFISYQLLASVIYTYQVAAFYGEAWSMDKHGLAMNGNAVFGDMREISELAAVDAGHCPNITSVRGEITMGTVGGEMICCEVANEHQRTVPYIEKGGNGHYLCGKWPAIDHVFRPLNP